MQNRLDETLTILQEECAEVIQAISKCRRFGLDEVNLKSGKPNRQVLTEEVGDLVAMLEILTNEKILNPEDIELAKKEKFKKLSMWSNVLRK